jgi:uncharacterized membrane protein HdeD (DUF308 family)
MMTENTANATEIRQEAKKQLNIGIILSVLIILLGLVAIALPNVTTIVAETWIAVTLVSVGFGTILYAIQTRLEGFIWKLLLGILYVATGIFLFTQPLTGVLTLTLLLGTFFLTEGVMESILAFKIRPRQNWQWVLVNGITTLGLGVLVWLQWPTNAPWLIGTLVGVSVLATGISRLMLSITGRTMIDSVPDLALTHSEIPSSDTTTVNPPS